jgi:hypothetical protein
MLSSSSSEEEENGTLEGISREILGRFPKHHLSNPSRWRRYRGSVSVIELVDEFASMASASTMDGADGENVVVVDDNNDDDDEETMRDSSSGEGRRLRAVLHPDALAGGDGDDMSRRLLEKYGNVLCRGARVVLEGYVTANTSCRC